METLVHRAKAFRFALTMAMVVTGAGLPAQTPKPSLSKRETRRMEQALEDRLNRDRSFAMERWRVFEETRVVGQPFAKVVEAWGPYTSVSEDGRGGRVYAYDRGLTSNFGEYTPGYEVTDPFGNVLERKEARDTRRSSHWTLFKDVYVNAAGMVTRITRGTRGLGTIDPKFVPVRTASIAFTGKSRETMAGRLRAHIRDSGYVLRQDSDDRIVFREFTQFGRASECGADLYSLVRVTVELREAQLDVTVDTELYSTIFGARLVINDNDDIAAENHEGFNYYTSKVPKDVRSAYPEAIYDDNDTVVNAFVGLRITEFYDGYVEELRDLCR
jgi:hypothetical protein